MGRRLSARYAHMILVSGYPVLAARLQLLATKWMCNVRLQALTLARRFEISYWLPRGADGQTYNHVFTKISRRDRG